MKHSKRFAPFDLFFISTNSRCDSPLCRRTPSASGNQCERNFSISLDFLFLVRRQPCTSPIGLLKLMTDSSKHCLKILTLKSIARAIARALTGRGRRSALCAASHRAWHLSVDKTEPRDSTQEAKLDALKAWLEKQMRHVKLPQLLIEVDNELHFTRHFLPLAQQQSRPVHEIAAIIAAIMFASLSSLHKTVNYKRCSWL